MKSKSRLLRRRTKQIICFTLIAIDFLVTPMQCLAVDKLPNSQDGKNDFVVSTPNPLTPEEMNSLVEELAKEYKSDMIEKIPSEGIRCYCSREWRGYKRKKAFCKIARTGRRIAEICRY